ncbi:hypothetical protein ACS0TY_015951 [Phlomoides rotata]
MSSFLDISIAYLNKKRKPQTELLDTPLPKHVCWGQKLEYDFSSQSTIEPKKVSSSIFTRVESAPESVSNSYSFPDDSDSSMSSYDDTKTSLPYPKSLYSIENRSSTTKASSKKPESTSVIDYELLEYESHGDCSFSEYQFDGVENCPNTDLEDLLYSNGVDSSNYVLSSGRWPVGQESREKTKKLTIDKEFEEYFSMLML